MLREKNIYKPLCKKCPNLKKIAKDKNLLKYLESNLSRSEKHSHSVLKYKIAGLIQGWCVGNNKETYINAINSAAQYIEELIRSQYIQKWGEIEKRTKEFIVVEIIAIECIRYFLDKDILTGFSTYEEDASGSKIEMIWYTFK